MNTRVATTFCLEVKLLGHGDYSEHRKMGSTSWGDSYDNLFASWGLPFTSTFFRADTDFKPPRLQLSGEQNCETLYVGI